MEDGYDDDQGGSLDDALDEFLCEYVDGTMDPAVKRSFEEYLSANPLLAEHVQELLQARHMLRNCACSCTPAAPTAFQRKLRTQIARDVLLHQIPMGNQASSSLGRLAVVTSAAGLALILGMLFGTVLLSGSGPAVNVPGEVVTKEPAVTPGQPLERLAAPSDAHAARGEFRPAGGAMMGVVAPASALPAVKSSRDMTPIGWTTGVDTMRVNRRLAD